MSYLTDRKRATGLGAAHSGTMHHWHMMVSAVALIGLIFFFVYSFGTTLGSSYEEARAVYARPFPAIVALLTIIVGFVHYKGGVQTMIEDYVHGAAGRIAIIGTTLLSYFLMGVAAFSIIRLAL
ncbi:MAG: succinate dehydrogenase, hydrophobic membrane anchor protein [Rhodobacterales bacterium]|nr:MAG: succinate dehydrogenase, hydrophobic membrane anchor protein [Rhodobacterales bacterium]